MPPAGQGPCVRGIMLNWGTAGEIYFPFSFGVPGTATANEREHIEVQGHNERAGDGHLI